MSAATVLVFAAMFDFPDDEALRLLRGHGFEVRERPFARLDEEALIELLRDVDALITGDLPISERVMAASPRLKVIAKHGVGVDAFDIAGATRQGVAICNSVGSNSQAVADSAMAYMLALARGLFEGDRIMRSHQWRRIAPPDFNHRTLGIIGFGQIGRLVARRARGFDMRILAYDVRPDPAAAAELGVSLVPLETLLRESDFVTLHCSLTPEARHMINARTLALMKPTAFLVNTARGALVDEQALYEALVSGRLAGAGLDVREQEPPPPSPLDDLPNVIQGPHLAGMSPDALKAMSMLAAENVSRILRGQRPLYCVNPEVLEAPQRRW